MREYGQVQSAFWQSCDAQAFSDVGKLLALYLLTGPHANGLGCYRLPDGYVMADLGWSCETVSKGFAELSDNGFAMRFDGVVFIPNFLRWNKIANGNIATARFSEWEALPKGDSKSRVSRAMLEFCQHWSDAQRNSLETVSETVTQTVCQPEPNPTQPRKNPKEGRASALELPEWLPADCWEMWHRFRNSRKGWTPDAKALSLRTLATLRDGGEDPRKVIEQSIERGWTGLFPFKPRNEPFGGTQTAGTPRQRRELGT